MAEYKELSMLEFYRRLSKASGLSIRATKELHKAYIEVYTQCMLNGESFLLPAVGTLRMEPYDTDTVRSPKDGTLIPRVNLYKFKFYPSQRAKRCRKKAK